MHPSLVEIGALLLEKTMKSETGEEDENVNKANADNTQHNQNKMFMGYITHLRNTWIPIKKHKCPKYDDSILLIT